jgi:aspartyl-tRNA(Asn)/glutamyl-tRNA(Gln) amidotransferase subunit B
LQRAKEESSDYRYFPDPDLPPAIVSEADLDRLRCNLGELPQALRDRLQSQYALPRYDASVMVNQGRAFVAYFEDVAAESGDPRRAANWMQQEILKTLNETGAPFESFAIPAKELAALIGKQAQGELDSSKAKEVFAYLLEQGGTTAQAIETLGFVAIDKSELTALCEELVAANPKVIEEYSKGKTQSVGALVGQAKKRNPNVSPGDVKEICLAIVQRKIAESA